MSEIGDSWKQFDVIAIDEGQFFEDIAEFAEHAANNGKIVLMSSLYGTYENKEWPNISKLVPLCEKVKRLSAICKICGHKAPYTFRTV